MRSIRLMFCFFSVIALLMGLVFLSCDEDDGTTGPKATATPTPTIKPPNTPTPKPTATPAGYNIDGVWRVDRQYIDALNPWGGQMNDSFTMTVTTTHIEEAYQKFTWAGDIPTSTYDHGEGEMMGYAGSANVTFYEPKDMAGYEFFNAAMVSDPNSLWNNGVYQKIGGGVMYTGTFVATKIE